MMFVILKTMIPLPETYKNMLKELKGIYNPTIREKMERGLVSSLIGTKARFGWGLNEKKLQH